MDQKTKVKDWRWISEKSINVPYCDMGCSSLCMHISNFKKAKGQLTSRIIRIAKGLHKLVCQVFTNIIFEMSN